MTVYKPSTQVRFKNTAIEAIIIEVIITEKDVVYKCAYFSEGEYKTPCVYAFEFEVVEGGKHKIGFK